MAAFNVELRQRVSGTFADTIYVKATWANIDNKPSTFTPTAHTHLYAASVSAGGPATTATKLATARAINGTNFDGSAAITTANWGTARTLTVGPTGKSVNGSGNVAWSLAEIGINMVTVCPTAAATAGRVNIYTGAACTTKYANWIYLET